MKRRNLLRTLLGVVLALAMVMGSLTASAQMYEGEGMYYSDYTDMATLQADAAKLSEEIAAEGIVMLKNNGTLPLTGSEFVSVFGVMADDMIGVGEKLTMALSDAGFFVNQALADYYGSMGSSSGQSMGGPSMNSKIGNEPLPEDFPSNVKSSFGYYSDLAVIVIARDGGEGSDLQMVTSEAEDNLYGGEEQGWAHKDLFKDENGTEYKHYLQLTDSEEAVVKFAESVCNKVVVIVNTSNVVEMGNLQNDEEIDGIFWIGRTGDKGLASLAKILKGEINPSGRTVDIWTADHTADPTWINYATGQQVDNVAEVDPDGAQYFIEQDSSGNKYRFYQKTEDGAYIEYSRREHGNSYSSGPDMFEGYGFTYYEEGIYQGYRYYETAAYEAAAGNYDGFVYEDQVVYPFGYGLSYTTFEWENVTPAENVEDWSGKGALDLQVKVTNTGVFAGKDVVEVYAHAPYIKGGVEKSDVVLVGFAKTSLLRPGQSEIVKISVNVQDIASFDDVDKNGNGSQTYELDAGSGYELRFQADSHNVKAVQALSDLAEDVILNIDDYSGLEVKALFSGDDEYNSLGYDPATGDDLMEEGKYVEMTRADFAGTFPDVHTMEEISRSDEWFAWSMGRDLYTIETDWSFANDPVNDIWSLEQMGYAEDESDDAVDQQPWVQKASDFAEGGIYGDWTQAASEEEQDTASESWIMLKDMRGVDLFSDEVIEDGKFAGMTGKEAWKTFMNELTWTDLVITVSNNQHRAIESIGSLATEANDSPKNLSSSFDWGDVCHIAATWNLGLAYKQGVIVGNISMLKNTGWFGPAMDGHRSPFSGRNNEYYGQDGYQAGMIAAAVVSGAQSRGCACFIKHFALNDQETSRVRLSSIVTEQAAREIYLRPFQIALQEGNAQNVMCSMGSLGDILIGTNYNAMTLLLKDEWGYTGASATDAWNPQKDTWPIDLMVRIGMEMPLQDADTTGAGASAPAYNEEASKFEGGATYLLSGKWDADQGTVVLSNGKTSYTQWYAVRKSAERILFNSANSNYMENGFDKNGYEGGVITGKQGEALRASLAANVDSDVVTYTAEGALPDGLSLNAKTGELSGTPASSGIFDVPVKVVTAGWLSSSTVFTIEIESAFTLDIVDEDGNEYGPAELEEGKLVDGFIETELVDPSDYMGEQDSIRYMVKSGTLPAGLELDEETGALYGTPAQAGIYDVVFNLRAEKVTKSQGSGGSGGGSSTSVTSYDFPVTFVVSGKEQAE
ncbi:MAG: glycoside hydrolase family 3 C-terminal domain-containing protein [Lachnospiraceae bacterium]|nr:glycoside hydrolase family 3 C-terminal domain-containing protein [Lachnospiraceae bacterium]